MFGDKPRSLPQHVALVLLPEFTMMPVTSAVEPLRLANRHAEKELYRWSIHTVDGEPARASNGLLTMADGDLEAIPPEAYVIVCGGLNVQRHADRRLINWLRRAGRRGQHLGAVCTGAHILAEMLAMIASQHGADLASAVAELVLHSPIRHHSEHQRMSLPARIGARHPKLVGIIEQMEGNLEEPLSPSLLAKQAGLSTRQLERLFRRYLDRSPKRYYLELRLKKARSLLLQTDLSVINVALACGFSSPSHFSKCYRAYYGRTPYRERGVPVMEGRESVAEG